MRTALIVLIPTLLGVGCTAILEHPDGPRSHRIQPQWQLQLTEQPTLAYQPKETAQPAYDAKGRWVVSGAESGNVVGVSMNSGIEQWRFRVDGKVRGAPVISNSEIFIGSTGGRLYNLDLSTGTSNWTTPYSTVGAITSTPAVSNKLIVFQNNENRTYAVSRKTGQYVWDQGRPRPDFFTVKGEGGPTIDGDHVYAGYDDGMLVAMNLSDGATMWTKSLAAGENRFIDIDTKPIVDGDTLYVGCFNVGVYAVGKKHGNIKWLHRANGVRTPALGNKFLYVATGKRQVLALDPNTGKKQWVIQFSAGNLANPVVRGDSLWITTGYAAVWANANSGEVIAKLATDDGLAAPVATKGQWVHMVTNAGALVGARLF